MALTQSQVVDRANASKTYATRMCMQWTRLMAGQEAVGDYDGDKAADAEDGWKSSTSKHPGDREPPAGSMVFYGGGSKDNGHAAISLGPVGENGQYMIRTTDGNGAGQNGTRTLNYPELMWNMPYLGWTWGIGDAEILRDPPPPVEMTRGANVDGALRKLRKALAESTRGRRKKVAAAIAALKSITPRRK